MTHHAFDNLFFLTSSQPPHIQGKGRFTQKLMQLKVQGSIPLWIPFLSPRRSSRNYFMESYSFAKFSKVRYVTSASPRPPPHAQFSLHCIPLVLFPFYYIMLKWPQALQDLAKGKFELSLLYDFQTLLCIIDHILSHHGADFQKSPH